MLLLKQGLLQQLLLQQRLCMPLLLQELLLMLLLHLLLFQAVLLLKSVQQHLQLLLVLLQQQAQPRLLLLLLPVTSRCFCSCCCRTADSMHMGMPQHRLLLLQLNWLLAVLQLLLLVPCCWVCLLCFCILLHEWVCWGGCPVLDSECKA